MRRIPRDTSYFRDIIRTGKIYVDKTPWLLELIRPESDKFYFLSRPRRFGKSLMIDTLDEIFRGNRDLFKGFAIDSSDYDWKPYPVIRLDMSSVTACAATLEIEGDASSGTGLLVAAADTTVTLPAEGTSANGFSGVGTFEKKAAGDLTLTGTAASFSGSVVVSAGTLRAAFAAVSGGMVSLAAGAAWAVQENVAYEAVVPYLETGVAGTILAGAGKTLTIPTLAADAVPALDAEKDGLLRIAALTGTGWTKAAAGDVRIDSLENYTGAKLTVSGGVLQLTSTDVIPAGCVVETAGAGIVQFDTTEGYDAAKVGGTKSVAFADGGSTTVDTSATGGVPATLAVAEDRTLNVTALTGAGDFYKTGAGTLNLASAEAFTGRIIVQDGTLNLTGSAGENAVVVEKGVFSATGSGTVLKNSFDVQNGTLQATDGASLGAGQLTLAAAGTVCVKDGGTFGWSELPIGQGTVRILSGGVVAATTLKTQASGKLVVSDGTGVTAPLTLAGGTLSFDAETTLGCEITQTATTTITVSEGKTATLAGKYTNANGKCQPSGPGLLVFAGGGDFKTSGSELFVQGGDAAIVEKDFTMNAYFGVEDKGRKLIVKDGATVTAKGNSVGLHVGTHAGHESVVEVAQGGTIDLQGGFHVRFGVGKATIGRLRVTEGGVFRHAAGGEFTFAYGEASTASVEVVRGTLETGKQLKKGVGALATALFDNAMVKVGVDCTLVGGGVEGELRGANTLDLGARTVTLGEGWTGTGSLAVTGSDGAFKLATSIPGWTGELSVTGADLALGADVALVNDSVTVTDGAVAVADGTASLPLLDGVSATKTGAGTLVLSAVEDSAFDLTVEAGGVQIVPGMTLKPAGVPALWLDASAEDSFKKDGDAISEWWDCRYGVEVCALKVNGHNAPIYRADGFDGRPFVDFGVMADNGRVGDNRMMQFEAQQNNIRTVFWMIGSRNGGGFLLGDKNVSGSARCFHRGGSTYGAVPSDPLWNSGSDRGGYVKSGTTWRNGIEIDGTKTGLGGAWDLVAWRLSETHDAADTTPSANWLASCYAATESGGRLNGGQDLAEIIIYTNRLTDAEVRATQRYLAGKWMPTNAANRVSLGTVTMRGDNTSFTVDDGVPAFVANVVVEGRGVTVNGVATDVANNVTLGTVSVVEGGEWNAANFLETTVTNLTFEANAIVGATVDAEGRAASLTLQGALTLPATLLYNVSVPEKVTVRRTEILKVETLTGAPSWSRAEGGSTAASVFTDAASKALFLQGHSGTLLYIR